MKDNLLKIKRTNGVIDDGWKIHGGIKISRELSRIIYCTKNTSGGNFIEKYVSVDVILELNKLSI